MRSLNGLLALSLRWLELVRSLRSLLRSAEAAGHKAGRAFAHHELGSLHLCVGQAEKAQEHLDEALRIEEQLGDLAGRCATRHNLDAARRELAGRPGGVRPPRRLLRLAVLAAVFVGLGAAGTSIAFAIRDGATTRQRAIAPRSRSRVEQDFEPDNPRGRSASRSAAPRAARRTPRRKPRARPRPPSSRSAASARALPARPPSVRRRPVTRRTSATAGTSRSRKATPPPARSPAGARWPAR